MDILLGHKPRVESKPSDDPDERAIRIAIRPTERFELREVICVFPVISDADFAVYRICAVTGHDS